MVVDAYIRVSQVGTRVGERFISAAVQREQIEHWVKLNGLILGEVFEELDQSGVRPDRPMLTDAIDRVERGESQGIVVARLDRFGRSLIDGLTTIDRITTAGGTFISVQDGLDLGTPTGNLMLRIMFSMAEWELDRVRANWDIALDRAVSRGVHPVAVVPIGYRRGKDQRLKVDSKAAVIIAELFRRRGAGASMYELASFLNETGLKTARGGKQFAPSSVAAIIGNRVYLGEARYGRHLNPSAHRPIVDPATWQHAQRPRKIRGRPRTSPLGGVLRCGTCRLAMATFASVSSEMKALAYRCPGHSSAGKCPAPANARGEDIEALVEEFAFRAARTGETPRRGALKRVGELEASLARAEQAVNRYRDNLRLMDTLGADSFAAGLEKRQGAVERVALELAGARRSTEILDTPSAEQLEAAWPSLSITERRSVIEEYIDCIFIVAGSLPASERAYVCRRGDAPVDLPRRGLPVGEIRSFNPSNSRSVRLRDPTLWSTRRIELELRSFLGEKTVWPRYVEFAIAGCSRLHYQVMNWGGPYFWAMRLGVNISSRAVHWNEVRIRAALKPFLRHRTVWPTGVEFKAAGLESLHRAVKRHHGIAFWAADFDLAYRRPNRQPYWTHDRIEADLNQFLTGRSAYPGRLDFLKADREDLYNAINRNGGHRLWAGKVPHNLAVTPRGRDCDTRP